MVVQSAGFLQDFQYIFLQRPMSDQKTYSTEKVRCVFVSVRHLYMSGCKSLEEEDASTDLAFLLRRRFWSGRGRPDR